MRGAEPGFPAADSRFVDRVATRLEFFPLELAG
jgi:hypothetical protein